MSSAAHHRRNYGSKGLLALPPYRSSVTQQEVRFTTLAGRYTNHAAVSSPSWNPPLSSRISFSGIMALQDSPMRFSSQNAHPRREFPAEKYVQVKRHVDYMMKHPYEKTLRHKVAQVRENGRRLVVRAKLNLVKSGNAVLAPLNRHSVLW